MTMKKFFPLLTVLLLAVLTLCTCASFGGSGVVSSTASYFGGSGASSSTTGYHFVSLPKSNELVVFGVSARLSSRDAEIEAAREDAAIKVSMYEGVWASIDATLHIGYDFFDYDVGSNTQVSYNEQIEQYLDKLTFNPDRDVTRNSDGSVFVKFAYPAAFPGNVSYSFPRNADGSPGWTTKPPREISGFLAGVGTSGRLERLVDTLRKSCEAAAASIVSNNMVSIRSADTTVVSQSDSNITSQSSGHLVNFVVLESWVDPKSRAVWTLAIAKMAD